MGRNKTSDREMVIGVTDDYRYIGVKPPLTDGESAEIPVPNTYLGSEESFTPYVFAEADGSTTIGFHYAAFGMEDATVALARPEGSLFVDYARRYAQQLGAISLDENVRYAGPGSIFESLRSRQ